MGDDQGIFTSLNLFANICVRNENVNIPDDRKLDGASEFPDIFFFCKASYRMKIP